MGELNLAKRREKGRGGEGSGCVRELCSCRQEGFERDPSEGSMDFVRWIFTFFSTFEVSML